MKIIFLSDDFPPQSFGGAGIIAYTDAKALVSKGHTITVITTTEDKKNTGIQVIDGIHVVTLYSKYHPRWRHYISLYNPSVIRSINTLLKELKPDVVHAHNIHTHISYTALQIAATYTKKVFLTAHDVMSVHYGKFQPKNITDMQISAIEQLKHFKFRYNPLRNFIIRRKLKSVRKIFTVSKNLKTILESNGIKNCEVLYNGIDVAEWTVSPSDIASFKETYHLAGKKVILFGGRLSALKGGSKMVEAFSIVVQTVPEARLLIVGSENTYSQELKQHLPFEIKNKIIFTGWLDRKTIKTVYKVADVVAVPSLYTDPFPTVNLEAMASQKPIVGTCFGGTPEAVVDSQTGYIVDPHNEHEFAQKIVDILVDEKKAAVFGENGYRRVSEMFALHKHIEELLSWYTNNS